MEHAGLAPELIGVPPAGAPRADVRRRDIHTFFALLVLTNSLDSRTKRSGAL